MTEDLYAGRCACTGAEETSIGNFFGALENSFRKASVNTLSERCFEIADRVVRLRFAGSRLVPLMTRAFEHLAIEETASPSLDICLFDSVSTGVAIPPPPWSKDSYGAHGEIRGYNNERFNTAFNLGSYILSMLDAKKKLAFFWTRDASRIPPYEYAAPLRAILHWWMRRDNRQLVHAAAVGTPKGCVLIAGKGGSGKSSTALACLSSGLLYLGDDYVLLGKNPEPSVYSVYSSAKLNTSWAKNFSRLLPAVSDAREKVKDKLILFLQNHFSDKIVNRLPVRAILLPKISSRKETSLCKTTHAAALAAIAPSSIFQLPGAKPQDFEDIANFVKQMPAYIIELGHDIHGIADAIIDFLHKK